MVKLVEHCAGTGDLLHRDQVVRQVRYDFSVFQGMGMTTTAALMVGTTFQTGGAVGSVAIGGPIQKYGFFGVLIACFLGASVSIGLIGQPNLTAILLFIVVFIAGFGILGGQAGNNALAATYYPTDLRSTGVGAALGIGRIGSILGPSVAEFMPDPAPPRPS